jgi:hypothetical protein
VYTGLEGIILFGPPVGRKKDNPDQREGQCGLYSTQTS